METIELDNIWESVEPFLKEINFPNLTQRVFKYECLLSFINTRNEDGIYINLKTFECYSKPYLEFDYERTHNNVYLHCKEKVILNEKNDSQIINKPSQMAIGTSSGFNVNSSNEYKREYGIYIPKLDINISTNTQNIPQIVKKLIEKIEAHPGNKIAEKTAQWEMEIKNSKYAFNLPQVENPPSIPPHNWNCFVCNAKINLWLNLSDGFIGCGRKLYGMGGGCQNGNEGAALIHFNETGKQFPLVVKLGTITTHTADVFSYAEDENDAVLDPKLATHLAHFGINIQLLEKTEQTTSEMEIDQNLNFDWSQVTEEDQNLEPISGPHYIGMKNLGNSCYVNSVFQLLFSVDEFRNIFLNNSDEILKSLTNNSCPADDYLIQTTKLFSGLSCILPFLQLSSDENYNMIDPSMIKNLIGKGHHEFSTGRQQDAEEYLTYVLQLINRYIMKNNLYINMNNIKTVDSSNNIIDQQDFKINNIENIFQFDIYERIQCLQTQQVKYTAIRHHLLSLDIPKEYLDKIQEEDLINKKKQKIDTNLTSDENDEENRKNKPDIIFNDILSSWASEEINESYRSPVTNNIGELSRILRFKTFPEYLILHLKRFYADTDWTSKKINSTIQIPEFINLQHLKSKGIQDNEILMEDSEDDSNKMSTPNIEPDELIMQQITEIGFSDTQARQACIATKNASSDICIEWILNHPDGESFEIPTSGTDVDDSLKNDIMAMGFDILYAEVALQRHNNNLESALNWLLNSPEEVEEAIISQNTGPSEDISINDNLLNGNGTYKLLGFISHIGKNSSSGHYVAHIKKNNKWIIYNDDKVAVSQNPPLNHGYIYLFKRFNIENI